MYVCMCAYASLSNLMLEYVCVTCAYMYVHIITSSNLISIEGAFVLVARKDELPNSFPLSNDPSPYILNACTMYTQCNVTMHYHTQILM